jgi:hypothetical protein
MQLIPTATYAMVCAQVREDTTTLTLMDCTMEMAGYYECKAVSDLGLDKTRASLTVNSKSENLTMFFSSLP